MISVVVENLRRFHLPLFCVFAFALATTLSFLTIKNLDKTAAADLSRFNAGDIMSDGVMSNYTSMNEGQIQSFLKSKNPCNNTNVWVPSNGQTTPWLDMGGTMNWHVENGHFVCMADERFDGESAAHIIWQAAQDYKINPQVLIVLLQKEQGLVTDTRPRSGQYRAATGYGCPDTAACDSQYYGFRNQVRNAASLFRWILDHGSRYKPVGDNYIQYSPNSACGGSIVNIKNRATSALYQYTPYQPNASALAAGYGTASCGAYGNRNFYAYFTDWFGDTHAIYSSLERINAQYEQLGGKNSYLGKQKTDMKTSGEIKWIEYENGVIIGKDSTGFYESRGQIRKAWQKYNTYNGYLGLPTGNISSSATPGVYFQQYEHGYIVGSTATGYYESRGRIRTTWATLGASVSYLGLPVGDITQEGSIIYQKYQNGEIIGSYSTGFYESRGQIRKAWQKYNTYNGYLGLPTGNISSSTTPGVHFQQYERGYIVGSDVTGYYESRGKIRTTWAALGASVSYLGLPTGDITQEGDLIYQKYQNGEIIGSYSTGFYESRGQIRKAWQKYSSYNGYLGLPAGNIQEENNAIYQRYQNGTIIGSYDTGFYESRGKIRKIWTNSGATYGKYGLPISDITEAESGGEEQQYQNDSIILDKDGQEVIPPESTENDEE